MCCNQKWPMPFEPCLTCMTPYLQPPHSAGGVYAGGAQQVGVYLIPVKGRQRGTKVRVLVLKQPIGNIYMRSRDFQKAC